MKMFLICLFGGCFGLHKFMERKIGLGILYLLTFGLFGIGWTIDCIIYFVKIFQTKPKTVEEPLPVSTPVENTPPIIPEPITPTTPLITTPTPETSTAISKSITQPTYKSETHKVAGVTYREDDIISLGLENEDYNYSKKELIDLGYEDECIYQYEFYPNNVELIPEPDNPYDPNAIKVMVDNTHVGYVKSGSCSHVLNLLKDDRIIKIDCKIGGGKYKSLEYDLYEDKYNLEKSESPIFVHLKLFVK